MKFRFVALGGVLLLVATACGSTSPGARPPPVTRASAPATTVDPDVVPPVVTPAYVNAVLAALNHIEGNAVRLEVATGTISPQEVADIRAIYNDPEFASRSQILSESLLQLDLSKPDPGDAVTTVVNLMTATPACIFAAVSTNLDAVTKAPTPPAASEYAMLEPKTPGNDPQDLNPTPWAYALRVSYTTPTTMPSQCPA
ncbi:MAG: hypothetical protein ACRDYC_11820 [Acidimicrobiales bacterium]